MIKDKLERDWIQPREQHSRDHETREIVREYIVTEADATASRNANFMEYSVMKKIRHRGWNEEFNRLWRGDDQKWHYTTSAPQIRDQKRFLAILYADYIEGKDVKLSKDLEEDFSVWIKNGKRPENVEF